MFDFIKKLFTKRRTLGAYKSPEDPRNIPVSAIQQPTTVPTSYSMEMPPVEDQGADPKCVGEGIHKIVELYFKKAGVEVDLSADDLYEQCKLVDGIPALPGTYPSVGAHIAFRNGIATVEAYNSGDEQKIKASRAKYKTGGYAFVSASYDEICQTIFSKGAVGASFNVDNNWFIGIIQRVLRSIGRHYVVLHGFDTDKKSLLGQNSWGIAWIGYISGKVNNLIKPGHFEMKWSHVADSITDIITIADIPQNLLDEASGKKYVFNIDMALGYTGYDVRKLQERLQKEGYFTYPYITEYYGPVTQAAVKKYQAAKGIITTGNCYKLTRAALNK